VLPPTQLPTRKLSADQRRLLALFDALGSGDKASLLAFAEFLGARGGESVEPAVPQQPCVAPRPEQESVVAAMRRLSAGYPMLDKSVILHEAAGLMAAHTLQGRPAVEVIDELEGLFVRAYQGYLEAKQKTES
jgi:hypothetical protein